jgi:hypothetical protein
VVDTSGLIITTGPSGPQAAEIEVCHQGPNPFIDVCDVYECYEDDVAMQSICDYRSTYNKNCLSDGCP